MITWFLTYDPDMQTYQIVTSATEVSRSFALNYCNIELFVMLNSLESRSWVAQFVNQTEWYFALNVYVWQYVTIFHLLILQGNLKINIFETNKAGMFAIEKQAKTLLEILELE